MMSSLERVILFNLIFSQSFDSSSMSLLSETKLLEVLLLGGNGLSASNIVSLVIHALLLSQ